MMIVPALDRPPAEHATASMNFDSATSCCLSSMPACVTRLASQNDEEINENLDAIEQGVKGLHRKAEAIGAGLAESAVKIELAQEKTVEQTDKLKRTNRNLERAIARKESGCCGCGGPPSRFVD
jgi:hypothetical protein